MTFLIVLLLWEVSNILVNLNIVRLEMGQRKYLFDLLVVGIFM